MLIYGKTKVHNFSVHHFRMYKTWTKLFKNVVHSINTGQSIMKFSQIQKTYQAWYTMNSILNKTKSVVMRTQNSNV